MQVTQVNSSATSALSPNPAEDQVSRADDFARVLQTAFYGQGGEAVAKTTERAVTEAAPRGETRNDSRPDTRADTRSETRSESRTSDTRPAEVADARRDDETAPRSEPTPRESTASKPADKPAAKDDKPAEAAASKPDETAPKAETPKADGKDAAPAPTGDKAETEEKPTDEATKPVVIAAPDAALILSLLQTQVPAAPAVVPVVPQGGEAVAATPAVPAVNPLDAAAAALAAAAAMQGALPTKTAQAAAPAATAMPAAAAPDAAAAAAAPAVAAPAAPAPTTAALTADAAAAMAKAVTETSAAALLSQQQAVTPEDAATIQQALAAQASTQPQVQVQVAPAQLQSQVQVAAGKPALPTDAAPKSAETKPAEKTLSLDVQAAPVAAPKTLVDQSAFFAMQNDDQPAGDAALLNQQAQVAQQVQVAATETKFNAALVQANADAQLQANVPAAPVAANSAQPQQVVPMSNPGTPAPQAAQHATTQTVARQLGAYIPAGEQVAVQIKKGVNEGVDKISIKLDPGNLGKVEVKLEVGHDGRLMAVIAADKPETLQMLQQDAGKLEQSLRDAGLKTDQQSLNFTLRDQGQANDGREARDGNGGNGRRGRGGADDYAETGHRTDPAQVAAASAQRAAAARGGLDIRI